MIWSELARIALIGTDQITIPDKVLEVLSARGIETTSSEDRVLLDSAAAFNQLRKAGFVLADFDGTLPSPVEMLPSSNTCSPQSIRHLRKILGGTYQYALIEFLEVMVQSQKHLPPEFLPEIITSSLANESLWAIIAPSLSGRAHWLLSMNPDWEHLSELEEDIDWYSATSSRKLVLFDRLHRQEATSAIALLETQWDTLNYKLKLEYLDRIAKHLQISDEAFLEKTRKDKRKEVRFKAADILSQLPQSGLSNALFEEATHLVEPDTKRMLRIQLPEAVPSDTTDLGIDLSKAKKLFKSGLKAAWVAALVSKIPPKNWEDYLGVSPRNIIAAFLESQLSDVLDTALLDAIIRHKNAEWAAQLIRYEMGLGTPNAWPIAKLRKLVELLSEATFNDVVYYFLQYNGAMLEDENHIISRILMLRGFHWDERVSRQLIEGFRQWMTEAQTFYWNLLHYQRLLEAASYNAPAELVDAFSRDWPYHSPLWPRWEAAVQRFLQALSFRKEMITVLKNP